MKNMLTYRNTLWACGMQRDMELICSPARSSLLEDAKYSKQQATRGKALSNCPKGDIKYVAGR